MGSIAIKEQIIPAAMTPMGLIERAVAEGRDIAVIGQLMTLQERWDASQGRKAFDKAMAAAKSELPVIVKNREVDFTSQKGRTNYRYEDLAGIAKQIDPILTRHGLSYRYRTLTEGAQVSVTCIVFHEDGHFEENTLSASVDLSGNKNPIQAIGSTVTYLQRYALKAALGLAASNDDDARSVSQTADASCISDEQVAELSLVLMETKTDLTHFLKRIKLDSLAQIHATKFDAAMNLIRTNARLREAQ
jgi:hypothetical protein